MTTPAVGNRRLLKLASLLETVPRKRFDYTHWVGSDWKGAPDLSCGTTACAAGWATTMPAFRRLGLRLDAEWGGPRLGNQLGFHALAALFAIAWDDAEDVFSPTQYEWTATPKQVAKKIRRFVKSREASA